jgi:hypothetical protein
VFTSDLEACVMSDELQEEFEAIMQDAIEDAEGVKCELPEFVEGLELMRALLDERISCARDEIRGS